MPMTLAQVKAKLHELGIVESIGESDRTITLGRIIVPKASRGAGVGTLAMGYLTQYADDSRQRIVLTPSTDFGASSTARLKTFYKRFGFYENKGRRKDFTTRESMIRDPK